MAYFFPRFSTEIITSDIITQNCSSGEASHASFCLGAGIAVAGTVPPLNDIRKVALHLPEIPDAGEIEQRCDRNRIRNVGPPDHAVTAKQRPAETVDHANHRIEREQETPLGRDHGAAEAYGRDVKPELHHKRDDVTEIPVFDVQSAEP